MNGVGAREREDGIKSGGAEVKTMEGLRLLGISRSRAMVPVLTPGQEHGHPWDCGRNAGFYPTRPLESDPCGRGQQSGFLQAPPLSQDVLGCENQGSRV